MIADVAPAVPLKNTLHYHIPSSLVAAVEVGRRVVVPLGRRLVTGYVVAVLKDAAIDGLKPIERVLDPWPVFSPVDLMLYRWAASYYCCSLGEVIKNALPAGINVGTVNHVFLTPQGEKALADDGLEEIAREVLLLVARKKGVPLRSLLKRKNQESARRLTTFLLENSYIALNQKQCSPIVKRLKEKIYRVDVEEAAARSLTEWKQLRRRAPRQFALLKWIGRQAQAVHADILARWGNVQSVLKALEKKKLITACERETFRTPLMDGDYCEVVSGIEPTSEQAHALHSIVPAIEQRRYAAFLLHGVTGSGKTEVYLRSIATALRIGRGAIMLVPEIALTPQFISVFLARFGNDIAQIHSGLSQGERYDEWRRIQSGKARIVVGARSAIFSPVKDLGIIVVDEEHDSAYKQDQRFCYHARDLALVRGKMNNATVILGSATPMLETFYNTRIGKVQYLPLKQRIDNRPLPHVEMVDMRTEKAGTMLSTPLKEAIHQRLKQGEQTLLFLNRRGFARFVLCRQCGHSFQCPNCAVSLVYHQKKRCLRCHYCDHSAGAPTSCPICRSSRLSIFGFGTERIETEVRKQFPGITVARLDRDTTTRKDALRSILKQFRQGKTELLIGTQMIALGHDLPGVTLVGILAADVSLNLPDFRAGERTFQLLTQVAGRSGRGKIPGTVIIQTYNPGFASIQLAIRQDFLSFYQQEISQRKELGYPPFSRLVNIRMVGRVLDDTREFAGALGRQCRAMLKRDRAFSDSLEILGPTEAPWEKLKGKYRWHMLLKGTDREALHRFTNAVVHSVMPGINKAGISVTVDIDPINLL